MHLFLLKLVDLAQELLLFLIRFFQQSADLLKFRQEFLLVRGAFPLQPFILFLVEHVLPLQFLRQLQLAGQFVYYRRLLFRHLLKVSLLTCGSLAQFPVQLAEARILFRYRFQFLRLVPAALALGQ